MPPTLPTLFVSHGAPTFALEPGSTGRALAAWATRLPAPRAVLVVSAHWETDTPTASVAARPATIHDFHGFPAPLYALHYPAPGAPWLGERVTTLLGAAGFDARTDARRGLDHGAWVPMLHLYPHADVPVAQLSIQPHLGPAHHFAVGQALAPLTTENVLVIGSGSVTHNLREFRMADENEAVQPYVDEFRAWLVARLAARDLDAVLDYRSRAPHAVRSHPTEDHLLPLFVALGAAGDAHRLERLHAAVTYAVIGMDAYVFGAERLQACERTQAGQAA
jgi:4,5-DOPA dioxygenase extradiol